MAHVNRSVSLGTLALTGALAGALALGGCASKDDSPSTPSAGQPPISSAPPTPSVSTPTSTPTTTPPSPATVIDRLLATGAVPGLNATWHWQDGATGPAGSKPFGLCAKADLVSIGATDVVQRTYFPPVDTDDNAAEQIAEFPDATTTATAMKVLKSWQKRCASSAKGTTVKVGALRTVTGGVEYLVTRTDANADDGLFQAVGLVTVGTRIAVLTMDVVGQDYNYPAGQDPMASMVAAAAQLLS
ncbi:MAG: hypothetical protein ACJ72E_06015 [Marmoricola sp.]